MNHEVSFSIVGSGGDGAVAAGDIMAMACASQGLHVIKTEAYGPQIRGGESSCTVRISAEPISAQAGTLDAIVVFNWSDFGRFGEELVASPESVIFYDAKDAPPAGMAGLLIPVPFGSASKNMFALGLLAALFGLPMDA